ncbi:hypothetical protein PG989_000324 [Apiospora arundinis]
MIEQPNEVGKSEETNTEGLPTWVIFLALAPVLGMETGQLLDSVHDLLDRLQNHLGREGASLLTLGEDHVVHVRRDLGEEIGLALRQANGPRLGRDHLGVKHALDADVRRPLASVSLVLVRDLIEELAGRAPDVAGVLDRVDLLLELRAEPLGRNVLGEGGQHLSTLFRFCSSHNDDDVVVILLLSTTSWSSLSQR